MQSSKVLNIDEVDKILALETKPPSKTLAYFMWGTILFFWIYGIAIIILNIAQMWNIIGAIFAAIGSTLAEYSLIITGVLIGVFILMLISSILFLKLLHKLARELLHVFYIGIGAILLLSGIAIIALMDSDGAITVSILAIIGIIVFVLYLKLKKRIDLAGRMIEVSVAAVNDEKGAIAAIIIKAIIISWTAITWLVTLVSLYTLLDAIIPASYGSTKIGIEGIVVLIVAFLGVWDLYFLEVFFNAVIVRIIHDWYRSPEIDVASLKKGFRKAFEVSGALAKFAIVFASLYVLIQVAKSYSVKEKGAGAIAAAIVARILGITEDVIRFLGFYAVPAIVIRKAGFKDAFKDSIHKLRDLFIETLAGSFAFGFVTGFIAIIVVSLIGGIGYLLGYLIFSPLLNLTNYAFAVGLISGIAFFLIALIPVGFVTSAVSIAWKTILYEYGLDIEFAMKGVTLPSRLPEDIKERFNEILAEKGLTIQLPTTASV